VTPKGRSFGLGYHPRPQSRFFASVAMGPEAIKSFSGRITTVLVFYLVFFAAMMGKPFLSIMESIAEVAWRQKLLAVKFILGSTVSSK